MVPESSPFVSTLKKVDPFVWVFLLGFMLRLNAFFRADIFNSDGVLYIEEAQNVFYNGVEYLGVCFHATNIFPLLIAAMYKVVGDWELAGRLISLFFGTLAMLPLYGVLKHALPKNVALLTLLLFACNPAFVVLSVDILRGPGYWFFLSLAIYFILRAEKSANYWIYPLACMLFMVAASFRIEAAAFIAGTMIFLGARREVREGVARCVMFLLPIIVAMFALLLSEWLLNRQLVSFPKQYERVVELISGYKQLRQDLKGLWTHPPEGFHFQYYWRDMSTIVGWTALGVELNWLAKAMFEPVAVFFIAGLGPVFRKARVNLSIRYLLVLSIVAFVVLFLQTITAWWLDSRMMALLLIPGYVIIAMGLMSVSNAFKEWFALKGKIVFFILLGCVVLGAVVKLLKHRESDKYLLKEIGAYILHDYHGAGGFIRVGGSSEYMMFISYYANSEIKTGQCSHVERTWEVKGEASHVLKIIDEKEYDYFVWNSRYDNENLKTSLDEKYKVINEWDTMLDGTVRVYKVQ